MATRKSQTPSYKNPLTLLIGLFVIMLVGQFVFNVYLWKRTKPVADSTFQQLVVQAAEALSMPVPTDAQTGKAYLASQRLVLPVVPADLGEVQYNYFAATGELPSELKFTTNIIMSAAKSKLLSSPLPQAEDQATYTAVPNLQACSRGVHVMIDKPSEDPTGVVKDLGSKRLADGRTVYFYQETGCDHDGLNLLADYIKQIESY